MNYFLNLVMNESVKIYKRPRGVALLSLIIIMNFLAAIVMKYIFTDTNFTFWDHFNVSSYLIFVLIFVAIIVSGDIVSSEFSQGTIKLLLLRPASRMKILLSKFIAVMLFATLIALIHIASTAAFGSVFFYSTVFSFEASFIGNLFLKYVFGFVEVAIIATFALTLSVVTRSSVFSISFPTFIVLSGKLLLEVLSHYNIVQGKYFLLANTNLYQYVMGRTLFEDMTLSFSIVNLSLHMILFFIISSLFIVKRDINV